MNNNKGITIMALVITIIVMLIIFSISIYEGSKLIGRSKLQTLETNMLTIQAKVKAYSEEIEAKIWTENESVKNEKREQEYAIKKITLTDQVSDNAINDSKSVNKGDIGGAIVEYGYETYIITGEALTNMGLDEIKDEEYIALFEFEFDNNKNRKNYKLVDIIYKKGANYNNKTYYALSSLKEALNRE